MRARCRQMSPTVPFRRGSDGLSRLLAPVVATRRLAWLHYWLHAITVPPRLLSESWQKHGFPRQDREIGVHASGVLDPGARVQDHDALLRGDPAFGGQLT